MRIKEMITKGELRPVLKQFLPTSTVRNALGQIRRICMLILGNKGLIYFHLWLMHSSDLTLQVEQESCDKLTKL